MIPLRISPLLHPQHVQIGAAVTFLWLFLYSLFRYQSLPDTFITIDKPTPHQEPTLDTSSVLYTSQSIVQSAQYFLDYPLRPPYKNIFG